MLRTVDQNVIALVLYLEDTFVDEYSQKDLLEIIFRDSQLFKINRTNRQGYLTGRILGCLRRYEATKLQKNIETILDWKRSTFLLFIKYGRYFI